MFQVVQTIAKKRETDNLNQAVFSSFYAEARKKSKEFLYHAYTMGGGKDITMKISRSSKIQVS